MGATVDNSSACPVLLRRNECLNKWINKGNALGNPYPRQAGGSALSQPSAGLSLQGQCYFRVSACCWKSVEVTSNQAAL